MDKNLFSSGGANPLADTKAPNVHFILPGERLQAMDDLLPVRGDNWLIVMLTDRDLVGLN